MVYLVVMLALVGLYAAFYGGYRPKEKALTSLSFWTAVLSFTMAGGVYVETTPSVKMLDLDLTGSFATCFVLASGLAITVFLLSQRLYEKDGEGK